LIAVVDRRLDLGQHSTRDAEKDQPNTIASQNGWS
jgi:hypothetical protein